MFLRDIRTVVASSSGAPSYGTKHSRVASEKDISTIVQHITENKLLSYHQGRTQVSQMHNARQAKESCDAWAIGKVQHWTGIPLAGVVRKRVDLQLANKLYRPSAHQASQDNPREWEDILDDGSKSGSDFTSDNQFEVDDESASDGLRRYDTASDSSVDM